MGFATMLCDVRKWIKMADPFLPCPTLGLSV